MKLRLPFVLVEVFYKHKRSTLQTPYTIRLYKIVRGWNSFIATGTSGSKVCNVSLHAVLYNLMVSSVGRVMDHLGNLITARQKGKVGVQ